MPCTDLFTSFYADTDYLKPYIPKLARKDLYM